ncbi:unnamed protein product [Candida verbasci]|uniref:Uncharacterized protein n=1 Tax=Candida verbasci TaxID=1227364 RepID=A0A9W4TTP5_9ASCO|nr:unnamed protein product [Candida verbasci]
MKLFFFLSVALATTNIEPYIIGQDIPFDCIQRNIDTGEHIFEQNKIVYGPPPKCLESSKPLTFKYGIEQDFNCTITITDELYHLFQLYLHEDVPFSCRIPLSSEHMSIEKGGTSIPFTFNLRGSLSDSHLDIDPNLNVLFTPFQNSFVSAIAYSSSLNTTRVVIGDKLTLHFASRWNLHKNIKECT